MSKKEKDNSNSSKFPMLMLIFIFGGAMTALGTKEVYREYGIRFQKQQLATKEQGGIQKLPVNDFHGAVAMIKQPMIGRASFSAARYEQEQVKNSEPEEIPSHDKMAFHDLLKRLLPGTASRMANTEENP